MQMIKVNSSVIKSIGYDGTNIEVDLHNGEKYQYFPVSEKVFDNFLNAKSKGNFWNKQIKSKYLCRHLI